MCNLSPNLQMAAVYMRCATSQRAMGKETSECVGVHHLPVESRLLALVLFPNTESKSMLRPLEFCGCWGVGEAVNPNEAKETVNHSHTYKPHVFLSKYI